MKASESLFLDVRGLRYHVRRWGRKGAPKMFLCHGWMDVSASFQFLVDALPGDWDVYAPDWRGYGLTEWSRSDCYWFPDYVADLDFLLRALEPDLPAHIVGHSLGGNVVCLYAGLRPERVAKVVNLEGFGLPPSKPGQAAKRYRQWLDELHERPLLKPYETFGELAARLRRNNPRLSAERADFLARHWGREEGGRVVLRSDPAHKSVSPLLYRYEEVRAVWQEVVAPVLWVEGSHSDTPTRMKLDAAQLAERRAVFSDLRYERIEDAGHMLHHDQPEVLARLVDGFLHG
ncbi:MAG TPA: alpha/beta hydrolase [Burkholderiales bacterium]|nr:alpha/beta hydrolase [Burkholderiales bacterium]